MKNFGIKFFRQISVTKKIIIINGIFLLIIFAAFGYLIYQLNISNKIITQQEYTVKNLKNIQQSIDSYSNIRYWTMDYALSWLTYSEKKALEEKNKFIKSISILRDNNYIGEKQYNLINSEISKLFINNTRTIDAYINNNRVLGNANQSSARVIDKNINEALSSMLKKAQQQTTAAGQEVIQKNSITQIIAIIALVLCTMLGIAFSLYLIRIIKKPLHRTVKIARNIAQGDWTNDIAVQSTDETGQLLSEIKTMQESLIKTIHNMRKTVGAVAGTSKELSINNLNLSQRTEKQSVEIFEVSSRMEELNETFVDSTKQAQEASTLADKAHQHAIDGGKVGEKVIVAMNEIHTSSNKISEIIRVIDEISFQTNLLAINAAVEAARAGEQGKGFAVVAGEIRELSQRSANAAREINDLINDSVSKVGRGSKLVKESGGTLLEIINAVKAVNDNIDKITSTTERQSNKVSSIKNSMEQMSEITQQNAALVEHTAASSEQMAEQANQMMDQIQFFKIDPNLNNSNDAGLEQKANNG